MTPERWERIKQLFHAALEQEPGQRAEFLRRACASDDPLREEVEAMLARHTASPDFLESPALQFEVEALAGDLADEGSPSGHGPLPLDSHNRLPLPRAARWTRPPWWMFALAALFLADWTLRTYCIFLGPLGFDFGRRREGDRFIVAAVLHGSESKRAALEPGDVLLAFDGQSIRRPSDWRGISANLETGRTYVFEVERGGRRAQVAWSAPRTRLGDSWILIPWEAAGLLLLATAFLIGFSRPHDFMARMGALALATLSVGISYWASFPPGAAATWRSLPTVAGALLWVPTVCSYLLGPILLTFFALFPRPLVRSRWPWAIVWLPALCLAPVYFHDAFLIVYRPSQAYGNLSSPAFHLAGVRLYGLYGLLSLAALAANYFRLTDLNDRRRLRVLLVGGGAAVLPGACRLLIWESSSLSGVWSWLSSGVIDILLAVVFVLFPASFAYSILRHRLLDIRVIIRQGVQYAAARGVLLSVVPILGAVLVVDLLLHGDQPLIGILEARGWGYGAMGIAAVGAHSQRRRWGEAIDRRFFREQYDARRLLHEVAAEVGRARSFAGAAAGVVARIEAPLHSEFVAVMHRPVAGASFETIASSPSDKATSPIATDSALISVLRDSGDPLDVLQGESDWLQARLPDPEIELVRRARIDLIVPIAVAPTEAEALLVLGAKRSEQPYTRDDRNMLATIAANLELLLERPEIQAAGPREEFEECPACGTCYDRGTTHCARDSAELTTIRTPRTFAGRYRLERRLGSGGMGAVYEATDSALARRVALKVVREDRLGSPGAVLRFQREARAAAGFPHPNVVAVYDYGIEAGTRAFLVMELLEGVTLRDELRSRQRLDAVRVLGVFRGLCRAVEAAHLRQLIHRDLKPENIFLARSGEAGTETVKVLDFGIAKVLPGLEERTETWNPGETDAGVVVGTPGYMSPEQLLGEEPAVSWDLWALAVTAYESLTGVLPFPAASREQWRHSVLAGFHMPLGEHLTDPPASCEEFFARSLATDRERRPGSAAEFLQDLERALSPGPGH